jgi:pyruvate/2-oxoglutarate dehydrogenase complex dihydrolipoamide dehydrogenase (E3) component
MRYDVVIIGAGSAGNVLARCTRTTSALLRTINHCAQECTARKKLDVAID